MMLYLTMRKKVKKLRSCNIAPNSEQRTFNSDILNINFIPIYVVLELVSTKYWDFMLETCSFWITIKSYTVQIDGLLTLLYTMGMFT